MLTLFITSLTKQISPGTNNYNGKSILEAAYSYYKNYVLLQLYKGLFLIKVFNFKTADSWKNKLTNQNSHSSSVNKMGNTTQAAVKEQLLLNQGIKWMDLRGLEGVNGDLLANFKEEQLRYVMCDNILTLPEDHVVVGYEFEKINTHHSFFDKKDNITALRIIVHHGKINAFGFVQDVTTSIQGFLPADCTTPEYTDYLEDVRFIYNGKIEIPEGSQGKDFVITNLYFKVFENDFPKWRGNNYTLKTKVLSLVIEYHELQITKNLSSTNVPTYDIKMINKQTKSCPYADSNFVFKESLQGIFNALESKGGENNVGALGFDFFNSDNDYFHSQHRSFYIPKSLDTSGWNTPITGVKIKNNHLAFKSDFHKNMFNK